MDEIIQECLLLAEQTIEGETTTEMLMNATETQLRMKRSVYDLSLIEDELDEDGIKKCEELIKEYTKYIEFVKKKLATYLKFKRNMEAITNENLGDALKNMYSVQDCIKTGDLVEEVIDECYKYSVPQQADVYHCVCGYNPLFNISVFDHPNTDKFFIIGCECIKHLEFYALFEKNDDIAKAIRDIYKKYKENRCKLNKLKCKGCDDRTLVKPSKETRELRITENKNYKNLYCKACYHEDNGFIRVKCSDLNCNSLKQFNEWRPKCISCWKKDNGY